VIESRRQVDTLQFDLAPLASDPGASYVEIAPGAYFAPIPPSFVLGSFPEYLTRFYFGNTSALPVGCYYLDGAGVTSHGLLVREGKLLVNDQLQLSKGSIAEAGLYGNICANAPFSRFLDESIACVIGPGHLIYGHWLVDFLPKLYLLRRAGIDPLDIRYIIPKNTPDFGFAWLRLIGIPDSKLILFDPYSEVVGVKRLILPTLLRTSSRAHPVFPQAVEYLLTLIRRKRSIMTKPLSRRKLFVSRAGAGRDGRMLINRKAIEQLADEAGFDIFRPEAFSLLDQIAMFASAGGIIGEYGSALHGSMFSPVGTAVLALRSNAIHPGFLQSGLCQVMSQKIAYVLGAAGEHDVSQKFSIVEADFKLGLRLMLDQLIENG
jgi:capsular polysaccharide biosynthesis protein